MMDFVYTPFSRPILPAEKKRRSSVHLTSSYFFFTSLAAGIDKCIALIFLTFPNPSMNDTTSYSPRPGGCVTSRKTLCKSHAAVRPSFLRYLPPFSSPSLCLSVSLYLSIYLREYILPVSPFRIRGQHSDCKLSTSTRWRWNTFGTDSERLLADWLAGRPASLATVDHENSLSHAEWLLLKSEKKGSS